MHQARVAARQVQTRRAFTHSHQFPYIYGPLSPSLTHSSVSSHLPTTNVLAQAVLTTVPFKSCTACTDTTGVLDMARPVDTAPFCKDAPEKADRDIVALFIFLI